MSSTGHPRTGNIPRTKEDAIQQLDDIKQILNSEAREWLHTNRSKTADNILRMLGTLQEVRRMLDLEPEEALEILTYKITHRDVVKCFYCGIGDAWEKRRRVTRGFTLIRLYIHSVTRKE